MSLNIVFMGTPDFSVPTLQAIISAGHAVKAVYTQPPRPAGRRGLNPTPRLCIVSPSSAALRSGILLA